MALIYMLIAGVWATFVMTAFIRIISFITGYKLHVPAILGSVITMRTQPSGKPSRSIGSLAIGYVTHYSIGVLFAYIYTLLYKGEELTRYANIFPFGIAAALVAISFWFAALKLHPMAPRVRLNLFLCLIFVGHFLFTASMITAFDFMTEFVYNR